IANRCLTGKQHHQPIKPECQASVWRSAVFQGFEEEPETMLCLLVRESERLEDLGLNVAAMDTNGSRAEFDTVQDHIIRLSAASRWVADQLVEILVMHRCERVMRGVPALIFFVPLEHREVHHPQKLEHCGIEQLVAVVVLLTSEHAELTARLKH